MLGQPRVDSPTGLLECGLMPVRTLGLLSRSDSWLTARSHARAAHEARPGELGDGALRGVARLLAA
eukprot:2928021-Alexandrium_andersonii.AAC.1